MSGRGTVGGDPAVLTELAATHGHHGATLAATAADAAAALAVLRHAPTVAHVVPRPVLAEGRLDALATRVDALGAEVAEVADGLRTADTAACVGLPSWWGSVARAVRATDDVGLHHLPGLGWTRTVPAIELREAVRDSWALSRAIDQARGGRLDRALAASRTRAAGRVGAAAGRLVGSTTPTIVGARARDVLATPLVRGLAREARAVGPTAWRVAGRLLTGVTMVADGIDAVEEFAAGDHGAAWRSVAEVGGGALVLAAGPVGTALGIAIIGGVAVYENREAIARQARSGWRATTRAADAVGDAARGALEGARRLVGGLF